MDIDFYLGGAVAQMNWGKMLFEPGHPKLHEFESALSEIYLDAERHPGFVWRIPDDQIAKELAEQGFENKISATVSVWNSYDDFYDYTFNSAHGIYLRRAQEWFEKIEGHQLVIWNATLADRPSFQEAWSALQHLKECGPSQDAFNWTAREQKQ